MDVDRPVSHQFTDTLHRSVTAPLRSRLGRLRLFAAATSQNRSQGQNQRHLQDLAGEKGPHRRLENRVQRLARRGGQAQPGSSEQEDDRFAAQEGCKQPGLS